jgi:hypothetical protein
MSTSSQGIPVEEPDENQECIARARVDLEFIQQLKTSRAFQVYFMRRLREKIAVIQDKILDGNTPDSEISKHRAALAALKDVERTIDEDAVGCRSIIGLGKDEFPA